MENILNHTRLMLTTTPLRWTQLTQTLADELLTRTPAPGEWSALECLVHIVDTEKIFQFRVQAFLAGRDFPAFDPDQEGSALSAEISPSDLAAEFARRRAESLAAIEQLTSADLLRTAHHTELGPVTLEEMLHEWAAHDLNHTVQAERALMQPYLQGCGPWIKYFQDHVIPS